MRGAGGEGLDGTRYKGKTRKAKQPEGQYVTGAREHRDRKHVGRRESGGTGKAKEGVGERGQGWEEWEERRSVGRGSRPWHGDEETRTTVRSRGEGAPTQEV